MFAPRWRALLGIEGMPAPLIDEIEVFLAETGMPETAFGRLALGDPRFVGDYRRGRMLRPATCARAQIFMGLWGRARWTDRHGRGRASLEFASAYARGFDHRAFVASLPRALAFQGAC